MKTDGELTISVDGTKVVGWTNIEVTLRAEGFPNSFSIAASSHEPAEPILRAGAACTVMLGDDLVITGYIDRDTVSGGADTHGIQLTGRGKTQDMVDCSAEWPSGQLTNVDALTIAKTLALPYGIEVALGEGASAGGNVPQWLLNYGETSAEIIQRVARNAGLLAYEDAKGRLLLATVGATKAASGVVYGENVEQWSVENSVDGRYSRIVCCGVSMDTFGDLGGNTFFHEENDPYVTRPRLMYMVVENVADDPREFTEKKARWEIARRAGRASMLRATVDCWRDSASTLWTPNTLVPAKLPGNRTAGPFVLSEVTFRRNDQTGTTADLVLMPPAAFTPEPIVLTPINTADF